MDQTRDIRLVLAPNRNLVPQPYYTRSWSLVIGIDRYRDASARLANARNDAVAVADVLTNVYHFEYVHALYDEEATKDAILAWLRDKLPAQVEHNDRLIIFFAGHGTTRESNSGQKRGYLIPYEAEFGRFADYVDMSELRDACGWIPAKHILIILDCCFSGIVAVTARTAPATATAAKLTENYIRRITERGAWQVITAGAQDELVADSGNRPGHSAFTSALLAGLHGDADHNQDGVITASDLAAFIKPEVSRETTNSGGRGQIPFFSYFAGSDQGDFVLIKPNETPRLAALPLREKVTVGPTPFWTWGILSVAIIVLALMGWFGWSSTRETERTRGALTALVSTLTQEAVAYGIEQQATLDAVTAAPEATRQAVIATQTAAAASTSTAVAGLWTSPAEGTVSLPSASVATTRPQTDQSTPVPQSGLAIASVLTNPKDCAAFVHVPAGEFQMGPDDASQSQVAAEGDTIFVDDFWIGRTEVTNAQYALCVKENGCSSTGNERLSDPTYANHPVAHVTWQQANQYARWVGGRLPNEAEWEKAACGTETTLYPWGDQTPDSTLLNFSGVVFSDNTMPVGSYPTGASPYGLLDMAGNVQEWTSSLHEPYPYREDDGREDPAATGQRITRGGAFIFDEYNARCSTRVWNEASYQSTEIGFRVVITDSSILVDSAQCGE